MGQEENNLLFGIYITDTYSQTWECGKTKFFRKFKMCNKESNKNEKSS